MKVLEDGKWRPADGHSASKQGLVEPSWTAVGSMCQDMISIASMPTPGGVRMVQRRQTLGRTEVSGRGGCRGAERSNSKGLAQIGCLGKVKYTEVKRAAAQN